MRKGWRAERLLLLYRPLPCCANAALPFWARVIGTIRNTEGREAYVRVTVEILDQDINPARFFTPYVHGLYRQGNAAAYVTRGIGTIGVPARIGAPPEITLLRLRKT